MWSMGCILFEMLHKKYPLREEVLKSDKIDSILFKGTECYPLTFLEEQNGDKDIEEQDQLNVILK